MGSRLPVPPTGFDDLDLEEQIDYVHALWERIAAREDRVPVPGWHSEILDERLADLKANPDASRLWEDVKRDLAKRQSQQGMIRVVVRRLAEIDIEQAAEWYASEDERLGARFTEEVGRAISRIGSQPDQFPEISTVE